MRPRLSLVALLAVAWSTSAFAQQSYTFTTFDYPSAIATYINAIDSSGNVIGKTSIFEQGTLHGVGFVRSPSGQVVTLTDPNSVQSTFANGVSDTGLVVGGYTDGNNHG